MEIKMAAVVENYRDRMQRLALFDVLYSLQNKKQKDRKGQEIDYFNLGLLALLFFFENMLLRNKKTGVNELAAFYQELNEGEMDLQEEDYLKAAKIVIETFRPPGGKRNSRTFYNWETRKSDQVQYSILKANTYDAATNAQYYVLDEDGLELIFATKEYFSEFQLSMNQLLLRKQLEKGEFAGALRQIDEMRIDVDTLYQRIVKIKHEIHRNIISDETYERYKTMVEDINRRLNREHDEFNELLSFVRDMRARLSYEITSAKDQKSYEYIMKIDRELQEVHHEHSKLLNESIILKTSALQAARESLYYAGINSFNFNQEITSRVISAPLPLEASRTLVNPLLFLEQVNTWSPLTVFGQQRIENREREQVSQEFAELSGEEKQKIEIGIQNRNFAYIMRYILDNCEGDRFDIKTVVERCKKENSEMLVHRSFYDFFLLLHQRSPLEVGIQREKSKGTVLEGVVEELYPIYKELLVEEGREDIQGCGRYSIQNMVITLRRENDGL
ncbi:replicative DNA helicase [Geosporobacter ferrireducens]|uniref:replicative DNA helicase n=1 Tax=Geosporobacter ferrireducens TaxID=1424294 RepID=UPI00139DECAC|nr:replicative DNA helicase [Geosporobacter ferrireducens]MTI56431.1 replicative DNA helicase [Geosporobacter ferrireducens]